MYYGWNNIGYSNSYANNMRTWSNINCGLASLVNFADQTFAGVPTGYAVGNLLGNVSNGIMRNEVAYEMQRRGNPIGNAINMYAGYGNPVSNAIGTYALMSANCSPWMFFNTPSYIFAPAPMPFWGSLGMGFGCPTTISINHHCYHRGFHC